MREKTRNRIIGGVFLASLLVIVVPMFFDQPVRLNVDIPPMEQADLDHFDPPILDFPGEREIIEAGEAIASVAKDGYFVDSGGRVGEPILTFNADEASQWAVQLASFTSLENAESLIASAESNGHRVWISSAKINEDEVHRVVAGPFILRQDAQETVTKFRDSYELDPIVVGFSY